MATAAPAAAPAMVRGAPNAPPIPHITEGYVSLKHVVQALVNRTYLELQGALRTLPGIQSDVARKRTLLAVLVAARQEFVKLYVLCKWAVVGDDISRCIDVAAWLRGQHNCFSNVVGALFHLQQNMATAQLQHADIESALQVLKFGGPPHTTYGFVAPPPLTSKAILSTLRNLDVLLAVRLALAEKLPRIYRNYEIHDGRVRFQVNGAFWVDLGVADDAVDARFFFVDFGFDVKGSTAKAMNATVRAGLESAINERLAAHPLPVALDWALMFASNYKLSLLARQLAKLQKGVWSKVLSHRFTPQKGSLLINYWTTKPGLYQVMVTVTASQALAVKWLVGAKPQLLSDDVLKDFGGQDLDIEKLLRRLTDFHAKKLAASLTGAGIEQLDEKTVMVQLSATRSTRVHIDASSGKYACQADGPLVAEAERQLNSLADDGDMLDDSEIHALGILNHLRVSVQMETTAQRAAAASWLARPGIRLAVGELDKFGTAEAVLALRLPAWPSSWYVTVAVAGDGSSTWAAAQMTAKQRRWHVETLHTIAVPEGEADYALFARLGVLCTSQFALYELCRELDRANVRHAPGSKRLQLVADLRALRPSAKWACSALVFELVANGGASGGELIVKGRARTGRLAALGAVKEGDLEVNGSGEFTITIDVGKLDPDAILPSVSTALNRLDRIAAALGLARQLKLEVRSASPTALEFGYAGKPTAVLTIRDDKIEFSPENPQKMLAPFLPAVLAQTGLGSVMDFLLATYPAFETLHGSSALVIPRGATDVFVRKTLDADAPQLDINFRYWRGSLVIYVTANAAALASAPITQYFTERMVPEATPLARGVMISMKGCDLLDTLIKAL